MDASIINLTCPALSAPIPDSLAGMELFSDKDSRFVRFVGTRAAVEALNIVPKGLPLPGDLPKMRGTKWVGADGREWKLTQWRKGHLLLAIIRSPADRTDWRAQREAERVRELEAERDADPGIEAAVEQQNSLSAQLAVGTIVLREYDGVLVEIVEPYSFYPVGDDDGPYIAKDGHRRAYRQGYVTRALGEERCFLAAHEVRLRDGVVAYIRLLDTPEGHDDEPEESNSCA